MIMKGVIIISIIVLCGILLLLGWGAYDLKEDMERLQVRMDKLNSRYNALTLAYKSVVGVVGDIDNWMEEQKLEQRRLKSRKERCEDGKEKSGSHSSGKTGK